MPVSLHTHSWYSLLEGVSSPAALVETAVAMGHSALALTDTNNLYGAVSFAHCAVQAGLRPILGVCLRWREQQVVALAADHGGYRNLCRILSRIHLEPEEEATFSLGEALLDHAEGLHILVDDPTRAEELRDGFAGRLWLELVRPGDPRRERRLVECGRRLGLRLVASTSAFLIHRREYADCRLVAAVRKNLLLDRLAPEIALEPEHRLLSPEQMRRRFADLPDACRASEDLAGVLRADVLPRKLIVPQPKLTRSLDLKQYLEAHCERGLRDRGLGADLAARQRLRDELAIIQANQLAGYFLTVRDITREVRRRGHTMALRGSAGNSLVCYLLGITEVNPLHFRLEMERFLHPGRVDLPDIDLDFDWKVRDEIIDHVIERHGRDHVARISSHLFFQPRSAFREAAKLHGMSSEQVSELLTVLDARVDEILTRGPIPTPRGFPLERARWPRLVADARRLLGRPTHLSLHPGGIVITPQPIASYVPLQWAAKGVVMTQFEKDAIEAIGLVKIDLLGNRALSTVDEAIRQVRQPVPGSVASDGDALTLDLLHRGDTLGVTQLESPAMRHLLVQMQPRGLEDVIQSLAVIRPGAASIGVKECFIRRRRRLEPEHFVHPLLRQVLGDTEGLMLYEDDALRLLQALTGLPAAEADRFRKRISKRKSKEEEITLRGEFLERSARSGMSEAELELLWQQLAKFNLYSFCKSHAVSYGLIAWQAAYLKAHHPLPFWSAVLNNVMGCYPRRVYVEAAKRSGIVVLPPCAQRSRWMFTIEGSAIRTGLEAIAEVSEEVKLALLEERERRGPFADLGDLSRRVAVGPEALGTLIRAGALDFTGRLRPALYLEARLRDRITASSPKSELFSLDPTEGWSPPDDPPRRRWQDAWDTLGFIPGPPLFSLFDRPLKPVPNVPLISSREVPNHAGRMVRAQGLVATTRHTQASDGRTVQFVTLEDAEGLTEVTMFSGTCDPLPYLSLGPYVATGIIEERFGAFTLTAHRFERADRAGNTE